MILRRPYAFFIRFFKVFHIILAALTIYSITRMVGVISFITEYLDTNLTLISETDFNSIFGFQDFLVPFLMLGLDILLLSVMTLKKKPNKFYTFATLVTIFILILNWYGYSTMKTLTRVWLDIGTVGVLSDIYIFALMIAAVMSAITISRAIGFNIGRFDFNSDILKFDLSEEDNEEFEFVVDFDINDVKRGAQKRIRYFKYFVKENKSTIITTTGIVIGLVLLYGVYNHFKYAKDIKDGNSLQYNGFVFTVNDTYIIDSTLDGEDLPNGDNLIVVDANIKNATYRDATTFRTGTVSINIGENNYYPITKYSEELLDLGELYVNEKIKLGNSVNKLLVFRVPKSNLASKMYLGISDLNGDKKHYIKLKATNLIDLKEKKKEYKLGEKISLEDSTLDDINITINNFEVGEKFVVNYKFKYKDKEMDSIEYLLPDYVSTNYDKLILKIDGNFDFGDNKRINNFYTLFEKFGYLEYKINGNVYTQDALFKQVKSKKVNLKNTYYIEVLNYIKGAEDIYLGLKIRNMDYRIKLEKGKA